MFIEFTLSRRKAEFYRGIVNALNFFGGSPRAIIFDNLKSGVINGSGRAACFHPEFSALCGYWTKRLRRGMGGAVWVDCGDFELLDLGSILI
jgi:transposase